jgi:starch phosphorylase
VCTMVWARRLAAYKRADLLARDMERFEELVKSTEQPIQIIWAGKPYPSDEGATGVFNKLVALSRDYDNCAVLTGYELHLSKLLKNGSDIWLNTPRITREASGTSGMTAAMNGSVNLSTHDGWIPEFAVDNVNAFVIPPLDPSLPEHEQDDQDMNHLYEILEDKALPSYYDKESWWKLVRKSMQDIIPYFNSDRMADEYYELMYTIHNEESIHRNAPAVASAQ